ncbi:MAG: TetR/AcrR family transcriptional regulator [Sebaldella sp.]|nr:TetR/AcrR family transcriptional regulator [Sebaldella sp.]
MPLKEEKKKNIIEQSRELFKEKGYNETKVEDITKALGISKGSFYTYFKSKEEVLIEILKKLCAEYIDALNKIYISKSPKEILEDYIFCKVNLFVKNFYKLNLQDMVNLLENNHIREGKERIEIICRDFLMKNVIMKYENSDFNSEFIAKFIEESIDEHFCVEIIEEKIGNKDTYLERKKEDIDQIVNFIHNGLLKK